MSDSFDISLACLALLALTNALQHIFAGALKNGVEGQPAGQPAFGDMSNFSFRATRTQLNGVETLPMFFTTAFTSILLSVDVQITNIVCLMVLCSRMIYWVVYYIGVGGPHFGVRSIAYIVTPVSALMLGLLSVVKTLSI